MKESKCAICFFSALINSNKLLHPARPDLLILGVEGITEVIVGKLYLQFVAGRSLRQVAEGSLESA